jgi:hypothetical protein
MTRRAFKIMPRDWLLFGIVGAYLSVSLLAIFDVIPAIGALHIAFADGAVFHAIGHIPYVEEAIQVARTGGASDQEVVRKARFVMDAYLVMFAAYPAAVLCAAAGWILWGVQGDGYTALLSVFGRRGLGAYWIMIVPLVFIDLFVTWFAIHDQGYFIGGTAIEPANIANNNGYILAPLMMMSLSLFVTLVIVRLSLCYASAWRNAPEIQREWPRSGVPQIDEPAEVEPWKPER